MKALDTTLASIEAVVDLAAAAAHGLRVRLHAEQLSNQKGAALAARFQAERRARARPTVATSGLAPARCSTSTSLAWRATSRRS